MSRSYSRSTRLGLGIMMGVAAQLAAVGLLLAAAWLIVRAAEQPPVLYLMVAIVAVRFFGISRSVFRYVERLVTHDVALADAVEQRVTTYVALERVAPAGIGELRRGDVVSRVVGDVTRLQDRLLRIRLPWWIGGVATSMVIAVIAAIDLRSGAVVLVGTALTAGSLRLLVSRAGNGDQVGAQGRMSAEAASAAVAARELVAFGAAEEARRRTHAAAREAHTAQAGGARAGGIGSAVVLAVTGVTVTFLAAWSGGIDPVVIGVILLAPLALTESLDGWAEAERLRPEVTASADRLTALDALENPVADPPRPQSPPSTHDLVVAGVRAGWDGPQTEPVSFELPPNAAIAVTGPSGVGKSTLAYALLRLLPLRAGEVRLGGIRIEDLSAADVRSMVGYLGQDDVVFDTSIRENLRIADPGASDHQMREALAAAGLLATVDAMPTGLDTPVGEHGGRLSGGERQRLCLARLLLADHRVLILDEPTEHLDAPTADALMNDVLALKGRSLVVITHSPTVLAKFTHVVTLSRVSL